MQETKHRLINEITFSGLALALCVLFLLLDYIFPFSFLLIIIFVPLLCALLIIKTSVKTALLFLLALIPFCFLDIQNGFFYLVPNVLIGFAFGLLVKQKVHSEKVIYILTYISCLINLLSYYPIKWIFGVDIIDTYSTILNLSRDIFVPLYPVFTMLLSLIEFFMMYDIVQEEIKKFGYNVNYNHVQDHATDALGAILLLLSLVVGVSIENKLISIMLLVFAIIPMSIITVEQINSYRGIWRYLLIMCAIFSLGIFFISITNNVKRAHISFAAALFPFLVLNQVKLLVEEIGEKHDRKSTL